MADSFYTPFNPFGQLGAPVQNDPLVDSITGVTGMSHPQGVQNLPFGQASQMNFPMYAPREEEPKDYGWDWQVGEYLSQREPTKPEWYEGPAVLRALTGAMGGLSGYLDARRYNRIADSARQHLAGRERAAEANWQSRNPVRRAEGGALGYLAGGTAGQDDKIPAMLSDGEYVFDADTVAALGDGNNAAGASALDQMRENIRRHKRSASPKKIPPKAKKPEAYMKKGA